MCGPALHGQGVKGPLGPAEHPGSGDGSPGVTGAAESGPAFCQGRTPAAAGGPAVPKRGSGPSGQWEETGACAWGRGRSDTVASSGKAESTCERLKKGCCCPMENDDPTATCGSCGSCQAARHQGAGKGLPGLPPLQNLRGSSPMDTKSPSCCYLPITAKKVEISGLFPRAVYDHTLVELAVLRIRVR